MGSHNLLNYSQNSHGFSVSASYPLKRSFARVGVTYGYDISNVVTTTDAAKAYFQYINFSGVAGPNSLNGIQTSHIVPSYTYNTVNHPISPTGGRSLFISTEFAGSILGGNVNTVRPSIDVKYFKQAPWHRSHILAFHALGSLITGYGGKFIAAVLPHLHRRRAGCPRIRDLGNHADRVRGLQRERQRVQRRWHAAYAEGDSATA